MFAGNPILGQGPGHPSMSAMPTRHGRSVKGKRAYFTVKSQRDVLIEASNSSVLFEK